MKKKYQKMKRIEITKDCRDKRNWGISAGTQALIELEIHNPMTNKDEFILLIDNGTGLPELYPKSLIEVEQVDYKEV